MNTLQKIIKSRKFRNAEINERRRILNEYFTESDKDGNAQLLNNFLHSGKDSDFLNYADVMIEQAVGYIGIPLGLAGPLKVNNRDYIFPLATEEPSVIAAFNFASRILSKNGGIEGHTAGTVMSAKVYLENCTVKGEKAAEKVISGEKELENHLEEVLKSMRKRGGGFKGLQAEWHEKNNILAVKILIDVKDAMGANLLNSAAEKAGEFLEKVTGGSVLMAILSNKPYNRFAEASFSVPVESLGRETARKIVLASDIANDDPERAVTHNKGIMNAVSALAAATGNDTRALESAVHTFSCRDGVIKALSSYKIKEEKLTGKIKIPVPIAVTGGAVSFNPVAKWSLDILGKPDALTLGALTAAAGLAQNFAALRALVSGGIQKGHMPLHARRLAFEAGARNKEIEEFSKHILNKNIRNSAGAAEYFSKWKNSNET